MNKTDELIFKFFGYVIFLITGIILTIKGVIFLKFTLLVSVLIIILITIILNYLIFQILKIETSKNYYVITIIAYFIFLFIVLFCRTTYDNHLNTNYTYIFKWLKYLFTSRIVFWNVIGNIVIFIPFGGLLKKRNCSLKNKLAIFILLPIFIELAQYVTKKGIFDLIDIILNIIGCLIGYILIRGGKEYEKGFIK